MQNNDRPEKWWSSTPKIVNGKFLVVAILPNGEETANLFSLEELTAHLTQRSLDDADWWDCECGIANHPSWQACQFCKYPRRQ